MLKEWSVPKPSRMIATENEAKNLSVPKTNRLKVKIDRTHRMESLATVNIAKNLSAPKANRMKAGFNNERQLMEFSDYRVFIVGDLVWAKLRGWPAWPAKVSISL